MSLYEHATRTPGGHPVRLLCRDGTNDQDVAHSILVGDEYGLRGLDLSGWAVDAGAYTGAVTLALALDFDLSVVALEPVPENRAVLAYNVVANGLEEKVEVDGRALGAGESVEVEYGYGGRHNFVGNLHDGPGTVAVSVPAITLGGILGEKRLDHIGFLKLDCEGCEWDALADPAVAAVAEMAGEYHGAADRLEPLLGGTHAVAVDESRFLFHATRR